jgi:hypothetical protein
MAKTNLKLGSLGNAAVGSANASLGTITGNSANTKMSEFAVDQFTVRMPYTYIVENTSETLEVYPQDNASKFYQYNAYRPQNYQVTVTPDTYFSVAPDFSFLPGYFNITAKSLATAPYSGSNVTVLSAKFNDGFNIDATGYNSATTKNIYSVDSYNGINSDVLCVDVNTMILLSDDTSVAASELYVGDVIKTYVPTGIPTWIPEEDDDSLWYWWHQTGSSGEVVDATISSIYYSFVDSYVSINNEQIKCTKAHPLYVLDSDTNTYQFCRAEDLTNGDKLIKYDQVNNSIEEILVESVQILNDTLEIATITVDVAHTYLANGYVSHNKGSVRAPIPYQNLVCYMDAQNTTSYPETGFVWNDLVGQATGFNLTGGSYQTTAPVFTSSSPKHFTFTSGKFGIKQPGFTTSTGNGFNISKFNVTGNTGFTIIAFLNGSAGTVLENNTNFNWLVFGNYAQLNGAYAATSSPQTSWSGWNMHAVTAGTGTTSFYRNSGTAYNSNSVGNTGGFSVSSFELKLMTSNQGKIANLLYYNRVLTSAEINAVYNNIGPRFGLY